MVTVSTNPFSAYLAERFGHRRIAMIGGVVASLALLASSFTNSLGQMYLTYGVLLGIGYSFAHLPSYVMVGRYFRKKLSIAMGIALAGTGIGQCAMAFIIQQLKVTYGWRGTFMIMSGVTLNLCVAAALLRPLKIVKKKRKKKEKKKKEHLNDDVFLDDGAVFESTPPGKDHSLSVMNSLNYYRNTKNTYRLGDAAVGDSTHKIDTMVCLNNYNNGHYMPLTTACDDVWRHHSESSIESSDDEEEETLAQSTLLAMAELSYGSGFLWMPPPVEESTESESDSDNEEKCSPEKITSEDKGDLEEKQPEVLEETPSANKRRHSLVVGFGKFKGGLRKGLKMWNKVMDFSLWKEPVFVVIQVCFLCHYCGHSIVTSHLVKRARDYGIPDSDGAMLVAFMGITQSIGRVLFGGIGNLHGVSPLLLYSASTSVCGVCAIVSIYLSSYPGQMVTSTIFGLFMGSYITMIPVICAKYFGPEKFRTTSAFCFQIQGVGHIIGSPLGGWMRDITGIYDSAFYLAGVWLFCAAVLILLVPYFSRRADKKQQQKEKQLEAVPEITIDAEKSEIVQLVITTV
ncbi:monocarboxylate transporter 12-like isoform X2 [Ptychodera flava]